MWKKYVDSWLHELERKGFVAMRAGLECQILRDRAKRDT